MLDLEQMWPSLKSNPSFAGRIYLNKNNIQILKQILTEAVPLWLSLNLYSLTHIHI